MLAMGSRPELVVGPELEPVEQAFNENRTQLAAAATKKAALFICGKAAEDLASCPYRARFVRRTHGRTQFHGLYQFQKLTELSEGGICRTAILESVPAHQSATRTGVPTRTLTKVACATSRGSRMQPCEAA